MVEPYLDLVLVVDPANRVADGVPLKEELERIFAVQRKWMSDGQSAVGAKREILPHPDVLMRKLGRLVDRAAGPDGGVADGQPAHLGGSRHVAVHEARRHREDIGVVIEPDAGVIGREESRIDHQIQQVPHSGHVFEAVQPMRGRPSGVERRFVECRLEVGDKRVERDFLGTRTPRRRHLPAAQFEHDFFEHAGAAGRLRQIDVVERQTAGLQPGVVTGHAVPVEKRSVERRGRRPACRECPTQNQRADDGPRHGFPDSSSLRRDRSRSAVRPSTPSAVSAPRVRRNAAVSGQA